MGDLLTRLLRGGVTVELTFGRVVDTTGAFKWYVETEHALMLLRTTAILTAALDEAEASGAQTLLGGVLELDSSAVRRPGGP